MQIIPYTWTHTNFQALKAGETVNLECDILGKYVARAIELSGTAGAAGRPMTPKRARRKSPFAPIDEAVEAFRNGEMIIVVDDEDRENEGDLTIAAEKVTPRGDQLHGHAWPRPDLRAMTEERLAELDIPLMVRENTAQFDTAFTVIDRSEGRDQHRHLGGRSRRHGAGGDRSAHPPFGPGAAGPHVSRCRRATAACW